MQIPLRLMIDYKEIVNDHVKHANTLETSKLLVKIMITQNNHDLDSPSDVPM